MKAISNAGPLIHLSWIDQLQLLPVLFDRVVIPRTVRDEVLNAHPDVLGLSSIREAVADSLTVQQVVDSSVVEAMTAELDSWASAKP